MPWKETVPEQSETHSHSGYVMDWPKAVTVPQAEPEVAGHSARGEREAAETPATRAKRTVNCMLKKVGFLGGKMYKLWLIEDCLCGCG